MEILLLVIPLALIALVAFMFRDRRDVSGTAHERIAQNWREPQVGHGSGRLRDDTSDDDDDDDDDYLPGVRSSTPGEVWVPDLDRPPGQWRIHATLEVRGVRYRSEAARDFIRTAKAAERARRPFGVRLEAEPSNAHDRNAQKVIGFVEGQAFFIGYLDAESAKEIAEIFPADMPYHLLLRRTYVKPDWIEIYFDLLIPAVRSPFWKGRTNPFT
jgi:hypothetical protein